MPTADTVLLPLCVALTLIGLIGTALAWRRGRRGRVVQGLALALAPVALYLTGLLRLVWNAVVAVVGWAARIVFSPIVWAGLILLAVCVVLFVVGGLLARRSATRRTKTEVSARAGGPATVAGRTNQQAVSTGRQPSGRKGAASKQQAEVDPEMAEIEALLKSRGID